MIEKHWNHICKLEKEVEKSKHFRTVMLFHLPRFPVPYYQIKGKLIRCCQSLMICIQIYHLVSVLVHHLPKVTKFLQQGYERNRSIFRYNFGILYKMCSLAIFFYIFHHLFIYIHYILKNIKSLKVLLFSIIF